MKLRDFIKAIKKPDCSQDVTNLFDREVEFSTDKEGGLVPLSVYWYHDRVMVHIGYEPEVELDEEHAIGAAREAYVDNLVEQMSDGACHTQHHYVKVREHLKSGTLIEGAFKQECLDYINGMIEELDE